MSRRRPAERNANKAFSYTPRLGHGLKDDQPHRPSSNGVADDADPLAFVPVPSASTRHDGWSAERQRQFIRALAAMGVVGRAARSVGMGPTSAYRLRARPGAESFAAAWDSALCQGRDRAWAIAVDRALNGVVVPRFYAGRQVGTVHRYDHRLLAAALNPPAPPAPRPVAPTGRSAKPGGGAR